MACDHGLDTDLAQTIAGWLGDIAAEIDTARDALTAQELARASVRKMSCVDHWRLCGWAEGDGVAEVLELLHEAVAATVGVGVAGEVVAAEVGVVLVA